MKTKTKIIEVPELNCKITVEWQEKEDEILFPLQKAKLKLSDVEDQVVQAVLGQTEDINLSDSCRLQHIKNARHIFCYVAKCIYGFSVSAIAEYLQRGTDTVRHSIRCVNTLNKKDNPALHTAKCLWEASNTL